MGESVETHPAPVWPGKRCASMAKEVPLRTGSVITPVMVDPRVSVCHAVSTCLDNVRSSDKTSQYVGIVVISGGNVDGRCLRRLEERDKFCHACGVQLRPVYVVLKFHVVDEIAGVHDYCRCEPPDKTSQEPVDFVGCIAYV